MNVNNIGKRYIRIGRDSGCFLANYKPVTDNENSIIVATDNDDESGKFKKIIKN